MKKRTTGVICTLLSLALTGYLLADTFLLRSAYQTDAATDTDAAFAAAESNLESSETDTASASSEVSASPDSSQPTCTASCWETVPASLPDWLQRSPSSTPSRSSWSAPDAGSRLAST